jgi:hypothetical protein
MRNKFVPNNSKYVPLTQQKWLCTATCIQMVMLRHNIPLVPAELIANLMGLIVPEEGRNYFWNARTGEKPPAGWGTQASKPQYGPNFVFKKLGIPLKMDWALINKFKNKEQFYQYLEELANREVDILVCYDWGTLFDKDHHGGHLCVLDKVDLKNKEVRIIDPEYDAPKWRVVKIDKLFEAMKYHGKEKSGGFWELTKK